MKQLAKRDWAIVRALDCRGWRRRWWGFVAWWYELGIFG